MKSIWNCWQRSVCVTVIAGNASLLRCGGASCFQESCFYYVCELRVGLMDAVGSRSEKRLLVEPWRSLSRTPRVAPVLVTLTSRLETRTKESNKCASEMVTNHGAKWRWLPERADGYLYPLRWSIAVRTRKMVNYVWVGWSQGKPWWKLVSILTCKLFVKLGYRGERLIEPSSSWFHSKFPSGS